jgi:hypothetical protein
MPNSISLLTSRMIADFCRKRISILLPPQETERLRTYLTSLLESSTSPQMVRGAPDWQQIAAVTNIDAKLLRSLSAAIRPVLDATARSIAESQRRSRRPRIVRGRLALDPKPAVAPSTDPTAGRTEALTGARTLPAVATALAATRPSDAPRQKRRTGYAPREIVEFPEPLWLEWIDPATFPAALTMHMQRHGESAWHLHRAIVRDGDAFDRKTLVTWREGRRAPRSAQSLEILSRIERRYRLPAGYFRAKFPNKARATVGAPNITAAEQRRLAWHLPDDFEHRPLAEQEEILAWVRSTVISGTTDYRRFQAAAMRQRYAVRFRNLDSDDRRIARPTVFVETDDQHDDIPSDLLSGVVNAPADLEAEMADLLRFKTATLATFGFQRNGVWGDETAAQKVEHLGLMFGALAAGKRSAVRGCGVPLGSLSFGMLVFPAVWDWYVQWREQRRGFYTAWEIDMMRVAAAMTRADTGWMRQSKQLAKRLKVIPGLVSEADIAAARKNWGGACEQMHKHALNRAREIQRVARVHRDPFEPILPVLEAQSPVGEYRKITEEIMRLMPDERLYARAAAEAVRSFLLLRLGLHLGLRQKNLRQLLVCPRGGTPRTERQLTDLHRGELRWSERDSGWEVLIPSIAFKNSGSSFFGSKPFRLVLPDLGSLYPMIEHYLGRHRQRLIGGATDPGTFFVKTTKRMSANAEYDQNTFYEAWRLVIQRYGIYNPYTGRGAIKGLLPHGPHNVRDVLATHILKQTGSYEQASYAIQDTPDMVAQHYGRFLPQDKSALAARILNKVWEDA